VPGRSCSLSGAVMPVGRRRSPKEGETSREAGDRAAGEGSAL